MGESRIIKRYANRKLYDTQRSRYVTLDQIADMIRAGEDVKIVDNNSKDDLTAMTLAQIIFEEEKKRSFMPLATLRTIIQNGGESIQHFANQTGERMRTIFRREKGEDGEMIDVPEGEPAAAGDTAAPGAIREFLDRGQQTFEEWQKKVDDRIRSTVDSLNPMAALEKEVKHLRERLADLEKKLEE